MPPRAPGPRSRAARHAGHPGTGKCHKLITNPLDILSPARVKFAYNGNHHGGIGWIMIEREGWDGGEPSIAELLSDPIVELVLRRDGLTRRDVWRAVEAARRRLSQARAASSAAA